MKVWKLDGGKTGCLMVLLFLLCFIEGCKGEVQKTAAGKKAFEKFEAEFIGVFDVKIQIIGYAGNEADFTEKSSLIYEKMNELNKLYDIYNEYEGIANLKTVNDNAGIKPVKVDRRIIDLILFSKAAYDKTDGLTNIAMGAVLRIWHEYRTEGIRFPEAAKLPKKKELEAAFLHTDIEDVIVDEEKGTIYLADPDMSLDVGAIAKGYAAQLAKETAVLAGLQAAVINAGGNVLTVGEPKDGTRDRWGIGIQDPAKTVNGIANILDTVYLNDMAVVSSGRYQRFYEVGGKAYHHIIDPKTLFPAEYFAAVTVIHENSAVADYLSTAVFIAPYEQGVNMARELGAEVLWVYPDGKMEATDGYQEISKLFGGYSAKDE